MANGLAEYSTTGFGVVGLGVRGKPSPQRSRADLCPVFGHPGTTYNVALNRTWCLCGAVQTHGDTTIPHIACCGGALTEWHCGRCVEYHDSGERCPEQACPSKEPSDG